MAKGRRNDWNFQTEEGLTVKSSKKLQQSTGLEAGVVVVSKCYQTAAV
jgi:hypothetical protein